MASTTTLAESQTLPRVCVTSIDFNGQLVDRISAQPPSSDDVLLYWLGQAGFLVRTKQASWLIDPYLSDSLAEKYQGKHYPHIRMMPAPITVEDLAFVHGVLCTHKHTDHMDASTLIPLFQHPLNAQAFMLAPRAEKQEALARSGLPNERIRWISDGEEVDLSESLSVHATLAAHEGVERDDQGNSRFLGYILKVALQADSQEKHASTQNKKTLTIWHSGDCVPYDGLVDTLIEHQPDVALLPVNGRDERRASHGIPGNFHLEEAVSLCKQTGIKHLIAHHFDLFEFNTIDPQKILLTAQQNADSISIVAARLHVEYRLRLRSEYCNRSNLMSLR
ncbi:MBL fold metallo-hydrolase [Vibrio sp. S9_S30]|uniref:MBL fold metallo-hydrolase n=1 Tax=Vibrio sp. S9_S30 TaxID=2720226 RepID=UPI0016807BC6|nr:MBL fold metallo-hydrolase [Vibrio sp. S9_S30]MBD1556339.1 MBL fold metallo-hydrolase [Vibrio sp. S9_S30]